MHTIKGYKDEWRIQEYVLITFFISWLSWGILILLTNLKAITFNHPLGMILFGVGDLAQQSLRLCAWREGSV